MSNQIISYLRVSTQEQGKSANGLEAQAAAIQAFAATNGLEIIDTVVEVASGAGNLEGRPLLQAALAKSAKTGVAVVVSKLDRLSRDARMIMSMMASKARFIVAQFGADVDEFTLHLYAVLGQKERQMISTRTTEALAALKAKGVQLGNPNKKDVVRDGQAVLSLQSASKIGAKANAAKADEFAERVRPVVESMISTGVSLNEIARQMNKMSVPTARGGAWSACTVQNLKARWA